jgi:F420-dependent oxidoreductase-like protein
MKLGIVLRQRKDFAEAVDNLVDFERVGLDRVMLGEAYSFDAVSQMGYVAAKTQRIELAFGILPMYSRTPTNLAMTGAGIDYVSGGRCVLGIGASGPQVVEGFHGVKYDSPLARAREHVEICRKIWRRETSDYDGTYYTMPLTKEDGGTGFGKALKMIGRPVRERIPMLLAATGPKNIELAAEIFDEWQPFLFHPDRSAVAFGDTLAAGRAKREPSLGELGIVAQTTLLISEDAEAESRALEIVRRHIALYVGGMGARGKNFYNALAVRYGYVDEAKTIQDLYLAGRKDEAAAAVPDEFARGIALIGPAGFIEERVGALASAGVTCVVADPIAETHDQRVDQMAKLKTFTG